jgi:hypothetical protein
MYKYHVLSTIKMRNRDHEVNMQMVDIENVIVEYLRTNQLAPLIS